MSVRNCSHSDYFQTGFAEKYWVPWIVYGTIIPSAFETESQSATPFLKNLLGLIPIKYLLVVLIALAVWIVLKLL